jgi:glycosyltransferase involved in cell wall biosynthesis
MRFVQITPGSGDNFYCENCLRDLDLVRAMRGRGVDMLMVPLYLPVGGQQGLAQGVPIFFGGINVFLQQKLALFRRTPRWVDRWLDSRRLLYWAGRKAGMTSARDLGETTISMLQGRDGRQVKELDRLVEWLSLDAERPDVVCLSNALLLGLAPSLKQRLRVPVICLLQDEDGFVDGLGSPYAEQTWELMQRHATGVDAFVAVSRFYGGLMKERLRIAIDKVHVIPMGIPIDRYTASPAPSEVPTIGFLSRQCPAHGLDTLVDAFILLKRQDRFKPLRLRVSGGKSQADEPFIQGLRNRLAKAGVLEDVVFWTDFSQEAKQGFLSGVTVLSVPEKTPVAYGLYVLEALASGVPFVEPAIGVFSEIQEQTGGGVLYQDNTAKGLAAALEPLLADPGRAYRLGQRGREGLRRHYDVTQTVEQMIALSQRVCGARGTS